MFVLNLDGSPRKHEAVVLGRTGVLKGRIVRVATKGAHSNHVAFEDHPVNLFMCSQHRRPVEPSAVDERYGAWLPRRLGTQSLAVINLRGLLRGISRGVGSNLR